MEFIIDPKTLQKELAFVQSVVERKNTLPILANILIESISDDSIRINGTDLDVTIHTDATTEQLKTPGAICVQARKLFEIARLLPNAPVSFTKEDNDWVAVRCGQSNFRLPGVGRETFPELPKAKETPFAINSAVFKKLIEKTIFAITQEEGRYTLSGAKFEIRNTDLRIVTTDGHRLALVEAPGQIKNPSNAELDLLIPRKTLAELTKLATNFDGDINFGADDNHVYFQVGSRVVTSRLLSGQFPNYEMVMPKNNDKTATFNTTELSQALRRVALMADDRSHSVTLTLQKGQLTINSNSPNEGEANESLPTTFDGDELIIGFNAEYVQDFLNVVSTEKLIMEFKDGNSQAEFKPVTEETTITFKMVLMPMRTA